MTHRTALDVRDVRALRCADHPVPRTYSSAAMTRVCVTTRERFLSESRAQLVGQAGSLKAVGESVLGGEPAPVVLCRRWPSGPHLPAAPPAVNQSLANVPQHWFNAGSMVMLDSARGKMPITVLARWPLGVGIAATLAANIAHGRGHGLAGAAVAAWPAVALVAGCGLSFFPSGRRSLPAARNVRMLVATAKGDPLASGCPGGRHGHHLQKHR